MKRICICLAFVILFAAFADAAVSSAHAQSKSMTGTVTDYWVNNKGTSESITIKVGGKEYTAYITRPDLKLARVVGEVREVGKVVRIYYTRIVDGNELRATRMEEVKKPRR